MHVTLTISKAEPRELMLELKRRRRVIADVGAVENIIRELDHVQVWFVTCHIDFSRCT
jgi:hypothetical protein